MNGLVVVDKVEFREPEKENEFIKRYCAEHGISRRTFDRYKIAMRCFCGNPACGGWAAVQNEPNSRNYHAKAYGSPAAAPGPRLRKVIENPRGPV